MKDKSRLINLTSKISILAKLDKLTQNRIAIHCNLSKLTICRFLSGKTDIKTSDFIKLLELFGIDIQAQIDDLLFSRVSPSTRNSNKSPSQKLESPIKDQEI